MNLVDLAVKDLTLINLAGWNEVVDKTRARMSWLRRPQVEGLKPDSPCPCNSTLLYGQCHEGVDLHPADS